MKKNILSLVAMMGLLSSCGEDKDANKEQEGNEGSNGPSAGEPAAPENEPADAADVPEGFESLKITKGQPPITRSGWRSRKGLQSPMTWRTL
ncbi:MAG: hypothetical protein ACON38_11960 [Akkermansiaceae bacterium]